MTLTNHTRRISELAGGVQELADKREYEKAHSALVEIEKRVHKLRNHLDHLQMHAEFPAWSKDET